MGAYVSDFVAGIFVIAIVYVLVRPQSRGVELVDAFGSIVGAIVGAATDLATTEKNTLNR